MGKHVCSVIVATVLSLTVADLQAATGDSEPDRAAAGTPSLTATLSTLNLTRPLRSSGEVTYSPEFQMLAEFNITDRFGVAGLVSYGRTTLEARDTDARAAADEFAVGVQGLLYPFGAFGHGMQLGLQFRHPWTTMHTLAGDPDWKSRTTLVDGMGLVGYKIATPIGFTFNAQLGAGAEMTSISENDPWTLEPVSMFNLNVGWSF